MKKLCLMALWMGALISNSSGAVATVDNFQTLAPGPTEYEQYLLELINLARADPAAEATRLGLSGINEGPPSTMITPGAKQPFAFNTKLITAARDHVAWSFNTNSFNHNEGTVPGVGVNWTGNQPGDRTLAAGYSSLVGENTSYSVTSSTTGFTTVAAITAAARARHESLFIDSTTSGRGHRINILSGSYTEIGIGFFTDSDYGPSGTNWARANMANFDFGSMATAVLTGVVFTDLDGNSFYSPDAGEAEGGITVNAYQNGVLMGTTTTWGSGGYSLTGLAAGTYDMEFVDSSGNLASGGQATLGTTNVKLDLINPLFVPEPSVAALFLIAAGFVARRRRIESDFPG